jgi:YHS domain-containing protein
MVIDPVCCTSIKPYVASSHLEYKGRLYYFCSLDCRTLFERQPERYGEAMAGAAAELALESAAQDQSRLSQ